MNRAAILTVNTALFVVGCFLAARIVAAIAGDWLAPEEGPAVAPVAAAIPAGRSWSDRQVILGRNLFNVSTLAPPESVIEEEEDLADTRLALRLLGTVASDDPKVARAAVEDLDSRQNLVVRIGDQVKGRAEVLKIERKRIVLQNGPRREQLALDDGEVAPRRPAPAARRTAARRPPRRPSPRASNLNVRRDDAGNFSVNREDVESVAANPAALFSQARILPKYEDGQMVGVQLNAIKPGSVFEQLGIQDGDTITELNGIQVTGPEQNAQVMRELAGASEVSVRLVGPDGEERVASISLDE